MNAVPSEHIYLASADTDESDAAFDTGAVRARLTLVDRICRIRTELTLYEEGYMGVRQHRAGRACPEHKFDLRHLDARPALSRRVASRALRIMLFALLLAVVMGVLTINAFLPAITLPVSAAAVVVATVAAAFYARHTIERVQFVTRHGRVAVVTLIARWGSFRACRALVPQIVSAIQDASRHTGHDRNGRLRAELREHYRLRNAGLMTTEICVSAVQRILGRFE